MTERRYSEEEVAAIFDRASKAQAGGKRQLPAGEGMTLAGLQEIGREVGIPAELVAEAANSIDRTGRESTRLLLGLPIGVGRAVDLGRTLSDAEWERLLVDVRQTFDATGKVRVEPGLRQWNNGNLKVMVEPSPTGHQVRMQTLRSTSLSLMGTGLAMIVAGGAIFLAENLQVDGGGVLLGLVGAVTFAWGLLPLPNWARTRRRQMEELVNRLKP
jgi:hypothetical protein